MARDKNPTRQAAESECAHRAQSANAQRVTPSSERASTTVSVIIPAHNEEAQIAACVAALRRSGVRAPWAEIIVVDNESTDRTAEFASRPGMADVVAYSSGTIGRVRNVGASIGHGSIFAFVDADVLVSSDWFAILLVVASDEIRSAKSIIGATYAIRDGASWVENCWFGPLSEAHRGYINGGNLIVSRGVFYSIGGFPEEYETGEDVEFAARAKRGGIAIVLVADLKAVHVGYPNSAASFYTRELWHGRGDAQSLARILRARTALCAAAYLMCWPLMLCALVTSHKGLLLATASLLLLLMFIKSYWVGRFSGGVVLSLQRFCLAGLYLTARSQSIIDSGAVYAFGVVVSRVERGRNGALCRKAPRD